MACLRRLAQTWHTHDVTREGHNEARTSVKLDILDVNLEALNAAVTLSIGAERELRLGDTYGQVTHTPLLKKRYLLLGARTEDHITSAIDILSHLSNLLLEAILEVVSVVDRLRRLCLDKLNCSTRQICGTSTTLGISVVNHAAHAKLVAVCHDHCNLVVSIARKAVEAHEDCLAELLEVGNMAVKVCEALLETLGIGQLNLRLGHATVHLKRESRGNQNCKVGLQACLTALDVEELLRTEVGTETCLRYGIFSMAHRHLCSNHRVTAVRDIREGATVNDYWVVLGCLHKVGVDSILQQCHHSTRYTEVINREWGVVVAHAKHDAADTSVEVVYITRKAEDSHNLGCGSDVEACLCGYAISRTTKTRHDVTQRAVVHIEHAAPHNLLQTHLL